MILKKNWYRYWTNKKNIKSWKVQKTKPDLFIIAHNKASHFKPFSRPI